MTSHTCVYPTSEIASGRVIADEIDSHVGTLGGAAADFGGLAPNHLRVMATDFAAGAGPRPDVVVFLLVHPQLYEFSDGG